MRITIGFAMIIFCLTGCSEMRVIGDAAMRELRADAVSVNWAATEQSKKKVIGITEEGKLYAVAKARTFSSFRKGPADNTKQVKGLWEQHGS